MTERSRGSDARQQGGRGTTAVASTSGGTGTDAASSAASVPFRDPRLLVRCFSWSSTVLDCFSHHDARRAGRRSSTDGRFGRDAEVEQVRVDGCVGTTVLAVGGVSAAEVGEEMSVRQVGGDVLGGLEGCDRVAGVADDEDRWCPGGGDRLDARSVPARARTGREGRRPARRRRSVRGARWRRRRLAMPAPRPRPTWWGVGRRCSRPRSSVRVRSPRRTLERTSRRAFRRRAGLGRWLRRTVRAYSSS